VGTTGATQVRPFDMPDAVFRLPGYSFDQDRFEVALRYLLEAPGTALSFEETIAFPKPEIPVTAEVFSIFHRLLDLLYATAGVSYYKIAAPRVIDAASVHLAAGAKAFVRDVYTRGLGEFAFVNHLARVLDADVRVGVAEPAAPVVDVPGRLPLVPIGGGKDSIVSAEALRAAGREPVLFAVNANDVITRVLQRFPGRRLLARRRLDPQVLALNAAGAFNGHVPVTAINSLIAIGTSVLHGLGEVVMSNEASASEANVTWHGVEINHQWSKSADAERKLRAAATSHVGLVGAYGSALRPFSELQIARMFALTRDYDDVVTSCNAAFRPGSTVRWCGNCPKCRFVFLVFAVSMSRDRLVAIFGRNLLDDAAQLDGYRDLVGLGAHKPFECVGEIEESRAAVSLLSSSTDWKDAVVVRELASALGPVSASSFFVPTEAAGSGEFRYIDDIRAFAKRCEEFR
jgi:UDP-N-acetyl-alpha-D-muramoyl-L-alanyl-L-glutamate epimerase